MRCSSAAGPTATPADNRTSWSSENPLKMPPGSKGGGGSKLPSRVFPSSELTIRVIPAVVSVGWVEGLLGGRSVLPIDWLGFIFVCHPTAIIKPSLCPSYRDYFCRRGTETTENTVRLCLGCKSESMWIRIIETLVGYEEDFPKWGFPMRKKYSSQFLRFLIFNFSGFSHSISPIPHLQFPLFLTLNFSSSFRPIASRIHPKGIN